MDGQLHGWAAALVGSCMRWQLQLQLQLKDSWYSKSFAALSFTEVLISRH
jgi:hypothetical protein